jgi:hypothetical protein
MLMNGMTIVDARIHHGQAFADTAHTPVGAVIFNGTCHDELRSVLTWFAKHRAHLRGIHHHSERKRLRAFHHKSMRLKFGQKREALDEDSHMRPTFGVRRLSLHGDYQPKRRTAKHTKHVPRRL